MSDRYIGPESGFKINLGFLINVLVTIATVVIAFASLRNDTFNALKEIGKQEVIIQEQQRTLINMQITVQKIADDSEYFHKQYNEDMNRYVRILPK